MGDFAKAFTHNCDGSWTCVTPATLDEPWTRRVQVAVGATFMAGERFMNVDIAGLLDQEALQEESAGDVQEMVEKIAA
jgi:hypothetical protein